MTQKIKTWRDLFRDKHGAIVFGEEPNLPFVGWAVFFVLGHVWDHEGFLWLSSAFLFLWAYLEIRSGTTPFRRILGCVVMALLISNHAL